MGNDEFSISPSIRSQWQQRMAGGRRVFLNKLTREQFQLIVLAKSQPHSSVPQMMHRSIDPLPNTPRLIILNDAHGHVSLLAQRPAGPLTTSVGHLLALETLQLARKTVKALRELLFRFGPFEIGASQVGVSAGGDPLVWINSSFERSDVQSPLPKGPKSEETMVRQTVALLKGLLPGEMQQQVGDLISFSKLLDFLGEKIEEQRIGLLSQRQRWKPVLLAAHQALSPQACPLRTPQYKSDSHDNRPMNLTNNIPRFVKKMKQERQCFRKSPLAPQMGEVNGERKCKIGRLSKLKKARSLNCSPQAVRLASTMESTTVSFNQSQGRMDQLLPSKRSQRTTHCPNTLEIPLIHSLSSTQLPSKHSKHSIPQVTEEQATYREATFHTQPFRSGLLGTFCRGVSQSQQLQDFSDILQPNLSLQLQGGMDSSVVIHKVSGTGTFDGKFLELYEDIGRILF